MYYSSTTFTISCAHCEPALFDTAERFCEVKRKLSGLAKFPNRYYFANLIIIIDESGVSSSVTYVTLVNKQQQHKLYEYISYEYDI